MMPHRRTDSFVPCTPVASASADLAAPGTGTPNDAPAPAEWHTVRRVEFGSATERAAATTMAAHTGGTGRGRDLMADEEIEAPDSTAVRVALWRAMHLQVDA